MLVAAKEGEGKEPAGGKRRCAGAQQRCLSQPGAHSARRRVAAMRSAPRGEGKAGPLRTRAHPASTGGPTAEQSFKWGPARELHPC